MPWKEAAARVGKKLGSTSQGSRTVIFAPFSKGIVHRRKNYCLRNKSGTWGDSMLNLADV